MSARSLLILSALLASSALATPTLDPQFGDHGVIQRGRSVLLSGTANPRERVTVSLGGDTRTAVPVRRSAAIVAGSTARTGRSAPEVPGGGSSDDTLRR